MVDDCVCWVAAGAKLFYLSGMKNGKYMKREVLNLARFISVMKFRPLNWRMAHPYLLTDRLEVVLLASLAISGQSAAVDLAFVPDDLCIRYKTRVTTMSQCAPAWHR